MHQMPYAHMAILPYPNSLTRNIITRDGIHCQFRPIRPEDADALQKFVRTLSDEARYMRFLSTITAVR